jgi:hypothetical protein
MSQIPSTAPPGFKLVPEASGPATNDHTTIVTNAQTATLLERINAINWKDLGAKLIAFAGLLAMLGGYLKSTLPSASDVADQGKAIQQIQKTAEKIEAKPAVVVPVPSPVTPTTQAITKEQVDAAVAVYAAWSAQQAKAEDAKSKKGP